jgi:hypothetical protein
LSCCDQETGAIRLPLCCFHGAPTCEKLLMVDCRWSIANDVLSCCR